MGRAFNIYRDEICHLEHDRQKVMVIGAVTYPLASWGWVERKRVT